LFIGRFHRRFVPSHHRRLRQTFMAFNVRRHQR
jgi:hypothetical protein